jgi:hypothetical protein
MRKPKMSPLELFSRLRIRIRIIMKGRILLNSTEQYVVEENASIPPSSGKRNKANKKSAVKGQYSEHLLGQPLTADFYLLKFAVPRK